MAILFALLFIVVLTCVVWYFYKTIKDGALVRFHQNHKKNYPLMAVLLLWLFFITTDDPNVFANIRLPLIYFYGFVTVVMFVSAISKARSVYASAFTVFALMLFINIFFMQDAIELIHGMYLPLNGILILFALFSITVMAMYKKSEGILYEEDEAPEPEINWLGFSLGNLRKLKAEELAVDLDYVQNECDSNKINSVLLTKKYGMALSWSIPVLFWAVWVLCTLVLILQADAYEYTFPYANDITMSIDNYYNFHVLGMIACAGVIQYFWISPLYRLLASVKK